MHYEARGGMEKIQGLQSVTQVGDMEIQGMQLPMIVYVQRPNNIRTEIEVPQMGAEFFMGYDGERGWAINPMQGGGPQEAPPSMTKQFAEQADLDGILVSYADKGFTLEYMGTEDVRGASAHKIVVQRPEDTPIEIYLDATTHLEVLVKGEGADMQSGATVNTETYYSDYRDVDGMMFAFKLEIFNDGNPAQVMTLSEITINDELDPGLFAFPEN